MNSRKRGKTIRVGFGVAAAILAMAGILAAQNKPATGDQPKTTETQQHKPNNPRGPSPTSESAAAQPPNSRPLNSAIVLRHLNSVITWYRSSTTSVQSVGLPTDAVYQDNAQGYAAEAVKLAFQSARAEAAIVAEQEKSTPGGQSSTSQQQNLAQMETRVSGQIDQLQSQLDTLNKKLAVAGARQRQTLIVERDNVQGQLELQKAVLDAVRKMASFVDGNGAGSSGGLEGSINRLAQSIPEVFGSAATPKAAAAKPASTTTNQAAANSNGLIGQSIGLYDEFQTIREIDQLNAQTSRLRNLVAQVRQPLVDTLRATIQEGRDLASQPPSSNPDQAKQNQHTYDSLTSRFKQISDAVVPLSQEDMVLDESQSNLSDWRGSISRQSRHLLTAVLLRVGAILIALGLILVLSEFWRRITFRYIHDARRRRQFLVLRRVAVGFLIAIVLVLGFVTEFSSLATFAGFITAGIAVGLQAVLLSVAAYFFIIGRYGIRVGDRISVAGVTGDVVDIGLVRLYLMELAGTGVDLYPTGRIVVFSNSVLFQAGTPLYKQIPGTEYTWHEVAVTLSPDGDHKAAQEKLLKTVESVFSQYREEIEKQHGAVERLIEIQMALPVPESRLQFTDTGLEFLVRYPVEIRKASKIDDEITRKVLDEIAEDPNLKSAVAGSPKIRAAVKG